MPASPSLSGLEERTDRRSASATRHTDRDHAIALTETGVQANEWLTDRTDLIRRKDALIAYFREFMVETFDRLGVASLAQTQQLEEGLLHIGLSEEEIRGWETYRTTVAERQLEAARTLATDMDLILEKASRENSISTASRERWMQRFRDPGVPFKTKEYFVKFQMPEYEKAWKREAEKRRNLLKEPGFRDLTGDEVRKLDLFKDDGKFLAMHFDKRMELNAAVHAALLARKQKQTALHIQAKNLLEAAAKARAISPHKVGLWLEHIIFKFPNLADRQRFIDVNLKDYIKKWIQVRTDFNYVDNKLRKIRIPQGFNRLTASQFLSLSFEQRKSYVETADQRLPADQRLVKRETENDRQGTDELRNCKRLARNALDMEDWDQAEKLLKSARKVHTERVLPQDFELDSMERYLKAFKAKWEKEHGNTPKEAKQALDEMRQIFAGDAIPPQLRQLYLRAVMDDDTFSCLSSLLYNRIWCHEHGYLNVMRERKLLETSVEETQNLANGKHKKKGLENVRLNTVSEWREPSTVRRYDEGEWGPTVIHMPQNGESSLLEMIRPRRNNGTFRYWATLIPTEVSYEKQSNLVKNVNWILKRNIRILKAAGRAFSLYDKPVSLN